MFWRESIVQSRQVVQLSGLAQVENADSAERIVLLWYEHPGHWQLSPHPHTEGRLL